MNMGLNYPVSDYYRDHIKEGVTLSRSGGWWTAALLIKDPRSDSYFVNLYSWQSTDNGWKTRKSFSIRSQDNALLLVDTLKSFSDHLP